MAKSSFETRDCSITVVDTLPDGTKLLLIDENTLARIIEEAITNKIDITKLPVRLNSASDANTLNNDQLGYF